MLILRTTSTTMLMSFNLTSLHTSFERIEMILIMAHGYKRFNGGLWVDEFWLFWMNYYDVKQTKKLYRHRQLKVEKKKNSSNLDKSSILYTTNTKKYERDISFLAFWTTNKQDSKKKRISIYSIDKQQRRQSIIFFSFFSPPRSCL
jgi:hypothetical protein